MGAEHEKADRLAISRQVSASMAIAGHQPSAEERNIVQRWVDGEIDDGMRRRLFTNYAQSFLSKQTTDEPVR
jgi:hypothetical protein